MNGSDKQQVKMAIHKQNLTKYENRMKIFSNGLEMSVLSTRVHGGDGTVRVDHQLAAQGGGEERAEHLDTDIIVGDTAGLQTKVNEGSRNFTIMEKAPY